MGRRKGNGDNYLWDEGMLPPEQPDTAVDGPAADETVMSPGDADGDVDAGSSTVTETLELEPSEVALELTRIAALLQEAGNTIGSKLGEHELSEELLAASVLLQGLSEPLLEQLGLELPARDVAVLKVAMSPQFRDNVAEVMRASGEQLLRYIASTELGTRAITGARLLENVPVQRIVRIDPGPER